MARDGNNLFIVLEARAITRGSVTRPRPVPYVRQLLNRRDHAYGLHAAVRSLVDKLRGSRVRRTAGGGKARIDKAKP